MSFVCLSSPAWRIAAGLVDPALIELASALLALAPRVVADRRTGPTGNAGDDRNLEIAHAILWVDAHGLDPVALATQVLAFLRARNVDRVRAGVASTPIAAELASTDVRTEPITVVPNDTDRAFIAPFPVTTLGPSGYLQAALRGIRLLTCGDLAALDREAVEVRLGVEGVALWRRARADDSRRIFAPIPHELPHASFDCVDYTLTEAERLVFIIDKLAARVCEALLARGQGARELALTFSLSDGRTHTETIRSTRPGASRTAWMHLIRTRLEHLTLEDGITGVALVVASATEQEGRQGDLFDRGFATEQATATALARLADDQSEVLVAPQSTSHPLIEKRTTWTNDTVVHRAPSVERRQAPITGLTLQLLPTPRAISVASEDRRDHRAPRRYRSDDGWHEIIDAAGPDCVSGGAWDVTYARQYFRCVTDAGTLVWLYRDVRGSRGDCWYLHGWWD